jgi:hypothetical protein
MEFNQELVKALAHGDKEALEQIQSMPLAVRLALGTAVDKLRRDEQIVSMNGFYIYEQKKSSYYNDEDLGNALSTLIQRQKEAEERKEKIRQEHLEKVVRYKVERARAGLTY